MDILRGIVNNFNPFTSSEKVPEKVPEKVKKTVPVVVTCNCNHNEKKIQSLNSKTARSRLVSMITKKPESASNQIFIEAIQRKDFDLAYQIVEDRRFGRNQVNLASGIFHAEKGSMIYSVILRSQSLAWDLKKKTDLHHSLPEEKINDLVNHGHLINSQLFKDDKEKGCPFANYADQPGALRNLLESPQVDLDQCPQSCFLDLVQRFRQDYHNKSLGGTHGDTLKILLQQQKFQPGQEINQVLTNRFLLINYDPEWARKYPDGRDGHQSQILPSLIHPKIKFSSDTHSNNQIADNLIKKYNPKQLTNIINNGQLSDELELLVYSKSTSK